MCHHTGLIVCFACLFLSTGSSTMPEENTDRNVSCSTARLYEKYSINGSLSLEGLDMLLHSIKNICFSHPKLKEDDQKSSLKIENSNFTTPNEIDDADKKANGEINWDSTCSFNKLFSYSMAVCWG